MIDRTRWPVLVTYSDESVGHTGHVYKCSGWQKTKRSRAKTVTVDGCRVSTYNRGRNIKHEDGVIGRAWIQRWEQWIAPDPVPVFDAHWIRVPTGRVWRSGNPVYAYERRVA